MRLLGQVVVETAQGAVGLLQSWAKPDRLLERRKQYGGNAFVAKEHPDRYITAACHALLCRPDVVGFECKSDRYGLECQHYCHKED